MIIRNLRCNSDYWNIIPGVIASKPSNLKEIEEEIKKWKQEQEEDNRKVIIDYQARLHELDKVERETKRDGIYDGDLKENIEKARKKVINDYNKVFAMQNQTDIEVGIDALEVEDFCNIGIRSNSAIRISFDNQLGTSGTQNIVTPQNSSVSDVETTVTLEENNIHNPLNPFYIF